MPIINMVYKKKKWKREPSADTICYYQFDQNLNDSSGNGHNLSMENGSVTYGTESGGAKYAYFDRGNWTSTRNRDFDYGGENTISFYVNCRQTLSSSKCIVDFHNYDNNQRNYIRFQGTINVDIQGGGISYTPELGTWHLITLTTKNGIAYIYVDGVLSQQVTLPRPTKYNIYFRINQYATEYYTSYTNNMYISEFIWEEKCWSDSEISSYYNSTKSNYGL